MFIGHFGAAFATKKMNRKPSLGTMFMAAQWLDLVWPVLVLLGIEKVKVAPGITAFTPLDFTYYPFTHSLLAAVLWAGLFGGAYYLLRKDRTTSIILGGLVLSHWLLDLLVHRPDLPLAFGNHIFMGFGLWNSTAGTLIVESLLFAGGCALYLSVSHSLDRKGAIGCWSLIAFLGLVYVMNIIGPPPASAQAIGYAGLSQWLLVGWAYWVDRHRNARAEVPVGVAKINATG